MPNIIPIVFCFDKRIILGASVAIKSLIDYANESTTYDIRIFHSDLDIKNQKNITSLVEKTRHNIAFYYINQNLFKELPKSKGSWREIVYYRTIIPEVVKEYDKVIYSDVDVFFKVDLSEVYNTDLNDYEWAGVKAEKNHKDTIGHKYFEENKNEYIYWTGFMLINSKKMREDNLFEKFIQNGIKFYKSLKFYDLDLINITCDKIKELPFKYCTLETIYAYANIKDSKDYKYLKDIYSDEKLLSAKRSPAIIHYAGELGKPWRRKYCPKYYQDYINSIPKSLRQFTIRDFRKRLFNKV